MPRHQTVTPPPAPVGRRHFINWWKALNLEAKIGLGTLLCAILTVILAAMVVPEFRYATGLEKRPEQRSSQPAPTPHDEQEPQPRVQPPESQPGDNTPTKPKIKYVPLPNADPLPRQGTLVTAVPREAPIETVAINGEKVPVMNQWDLEKYLEYKGPGTFKLNPRSGKIDLLVQVGKDGSVDNVEWLSGDKDTGEEAKEAIRKWKFKPFTKNGEQVAVQTVIQLSPRRMVEYYANEPNHKNEEKQ